MDSKIPKILINNARNDSSNLVIDNGYSFIFSSNIDDWISQRVRRQQNKARRKSAYEKIHT